MLRKSVFLAAALLSSQSASAQAGPVAKVTSDQLVCQLSGDCAQANTALDTQDKPESRGFSIVKRPAAAVTNGKPTASTPARPAPAHMTVPSSRSGGSTTQRFVLVPHGPVGHADLSINFVSGSAELTPGGKKLAETFMTALRAPQLTGKRFMIGGHTDAVGSRALNRALSERRAQSLVDYLVAQGASRSQFEVKGFGFDAPLPGTSPKSSSNRRVEVVKLN